MIIESLSKIDRKRFKKALSGVSGVMLKTHNIKGLSEPKNVEVVYICLSLEEKLVAVNAVKIALAETRKQSFETVN